MKIGVLGSGIMGNGIAQVFAMGGHLVVLVDIDGRALHNAREKIEESLTKLAKKSGLDVQVVLGRIQFTTDKTALVNRDLVIEAVTENIDVKKRVFQELDEICNENTILASNTSSLSVSEMAIVTNRPDRVCGLHFFNPVPLMKLVEVVGTEQTSADTLNTVQEVINTINKESILVKDTPLFVVNRLLVPMLSEAIFLVEEGTASVEDIDKGMQLGASHPIGPLWLADMIGLDTLLFIQEALYENTGDSKYKVPTLLKEMVEAGHLGRKTGKGFYEY